MVIGRPPSRAGGFKPIPHQGRRPGAPLGKHRTFSCPGQTRGHSFWRRNRGRLCRSTGRPREREPGLGSQMPVLKPGRSEEAGVLSPFFSSFLLKCVCNTLSVIKWSRM